MDAGKQQIFKERREQKAQEVKIVFVDSENFNVVSEDGSLKYVGIVKSAKPHIDNYCTCQSFYHGNSEEFQKANGVAFSCKHIIRATQIRYEGHEQ